MSRLLPGVIALTVWVIANESLRPVRDRLTRRTTLLICVAGCTLFAASLFLPAIALEGGTPIRGMWCLVFGWPYLPSNSAVLLAPYACRRMNDAKSARAYSVFLRLSLVGALAVPVIDPNALMFVGYWVWVSAIGVTALGAGEHWCATPASSMTP